VRRGQLPHLNSGVYPGIKLRTDRPVKLWVAQLSSYSRTESGLREMPQGLAVMLIEDVTLERDESFKLEVETPFTSRCRETWSNIRC